MKTRRFSLEAQISHIISIIVIKGSGYVHFSPRFSIETVRNRDQIKAKRG